MSTPDPFLEAQSLERMGNFAGAEAIYRNLVQNSPQHHQAWHALGLLAYHAGQVSFALQCIEAAIAINGKVAAYHRNIGEMYRRLGQLDKAVAAGRRAVKLEPRDLDAQYNLGLAYTDAKDYTKAVTCYRNALKVDAQHGLSWNNLGSALEQQGDKEEALKAYEKAVAINARHAEAQNNAGAIYSEQGRLDEARVSFQQAIDARPDFVEAHYNLSSFKTYTPDDPHLAMLESVYANRQNLPEDARIRYGFALGKALDDTRSPERSFNAYEEANRLQHRRLPMNEAHADHLLERILSVFDEKFFSERAQWQGARDPERTPIFIVGMPRSGTTLLEQILCSHASVYGAGELVDLNDVIMAQTHGGPNHPFTEEVAALTEQDMRTLGEAYLKRVWKLSPGSRYITDKMPANFFYLGLIHLALPHAKIIHAMRDPMDSCFSCYTKLFTDTMEFAYDQGTLGRYYVRYMKLMQHWSKVLPAGTVLDLPYEEMVADTEGQARRVLEFVGLPWDPNCLRFHENTRLVKTASLAQVRKPIYKTSVARWKQFGRQLVPLLSLVRDYRTMTPEDEALLAAPPVAAAPAFSLPQPATPVLGMPAIPGSPEALHMEGIALYRAARHEEALACYDRALALRPHYPDALNSRGFALQEMDRQEEALADFQKAVDQAPEMAMARLNLGMAQLKLGRWQEGWENYEARWTGSAEANAGTLARPQTPLPQWNGEEDTQGKRLLVITEQGFGDTFQFVRYLPLLLGRFAKVGFACSGPTQRLMEWSFGDGVISFTRLGPREEFWSAWDLQCPLMSLPRAFKTRLETIPAEVPYLKVPTPALDYWRERLERAAPERLRVGIAWAGRKGHQYDARRSLSFNQILPLLEDPRVTWVSLQKWAPEDQRPQVPGSVDWLDWTDELLDFADTAALIKNLDLVISIDSSMVHLAGALGMPVWMMDRIDNEWRWLWKRLDSPWYPRLRTFRQDQFNQWETVVSQVRDALLAHEAPRTIGPRKLRNPEAIPVMAAPPQAPAAPAPQALSLDQAMNLASQHQSAGRLQQAEQILRQILQANPDHAHALHLLGVVAWQAGNAVLALELIGKAVAADSHVALFHSNLAEMYRQQGRISEAIAAGERAVAIDPSSASAYSNLGVAYYDAKEYDRAQAAHEQALALMPNLLQSLNNLGSIARAHKDKKRAAEFYRRALAIKGDYLESLSNLGAVLVEDDQAEAAETPLMQALSMQPDFPEALCNLGLVRHDQNRVDEAIGLLRRSLELNPGYPEAMIGLARSLQENDQVEEAMTLLETVVAKAPEQVDAWCHLGSLYMEDGEPDRAEAAYRSALAVDAGAADALAGLGSLRLEEGKMAEAEDLLRQAVANDPDNLGARFQLTQAKKVTADDDNLKALEVIAASGQKSKASKRISLHYALGKAYDDLKQWDQAFPHFLEGARLKRSQLHYSSQADAELMSRVMRTFDADLIQRLSGAGDPSNAPVFVLGMPRSGTTLTEQIIASHPQVFGAGELRDLMEVINQATETSGISYPDNLATATRDTMTAWGRDYVGRLRRHDSEALRITDKMPANYMALGLIHLMLPQAKVIHVKRNPVDTCVSCFTRLFNRHQDATYDLMELGQHYAGYARLMNHWRAVLPAGSFMEVQYEDIVADMEGQARRLIAFCDLPWDDACLDFHKTERNIRTASVTQVRQPIYTSSVERWRHYEKYLGPLLAGLGEFASTP